MGILKKVSQIIGRKNANPAQPQCGSTPESNDPTKFISFIGFFKNNLKIKQLMYKLSNN